jgi:uncharacterized protein (UPF0335 family)
VVKKADGAAKPPKAAPEPVAAIDVLHSNTSAQLLGIVERIERVSEEIEGLGEDRKEIYAEAKGNGYDVPTIRKVLQRRRQDAAKRAEGEAILDLYETAIDAAERKAHGSVFKEED